MAWLPSPSQVTRGSNNLGSLYQAHRSWMYLSGVAPGTLLGSDIAQVLADLGEGRNRSMEIQQGAT